MALVALHLREKMKNELRNAYFIRFPSLAVPACLLLTLLFVTSAACQTGDPILIAQPIAHPYDNSLTSAGSFYQSNKWLVWGGLAGFAGLTLIIVWLLADIRRHLHAEARLVESENRFRSLSEDALIGIYIIQDSFFRYVNPKMAEIFGYRVEELVDKIAPRLLVLEEDWPKVQDNLQKRLTDEQHSIHYEFRGVRKDKETVYIEVFGSRTVIRGRPAVIGTLLDITDRKLSEDAMQALNAELELRVSEEVEKNLQKDRMLLHNARVAALGELLSNIAHQWRQPLNNIGLLIQGALFECQKGEPDRESVTACATKAMEKINYLSEIINTFQSFFAPEGERAEFDPYVMIEKAVALVAASYEQSGITLRIVNHGTVPVSGFALEFSQVILNLLNNAKDVLVERGTAGPAVFIECHCEDDSRNIIKIRDNAGGIPEVILDTIFDPYFTTKFKSQGTGLGLYMSKMIIENIMGGKLLVHNIPDGAEFSIELPV